MVNKSSEDFPNLARTIRESMDGRLPPIDDPDVKTYSYALYNCEYFHVRVFLSFETKAALQYFANDFPRYGFPYVNNIEDQTLKQEAEQWYSDFVKLMKYSKNPEYGKTECYHCLLSLFREEAAIFIGINKVGV